MSVCPLYVYGCVIGYMTDPPPPLTYHPPQKQKPKDEVKDVLAQLTAGAITLPPIAADGTNAIDALCGFDATLVAGSAATRRNLRRAA